MDDVYATNVTVHEGQQPVWGIERTTPTAVAAAGCRTNEQHDPFPLNYGSEPGCWATTTEQSALRTGVIYYVEAGGSLRDGSGRFRLTSANTIENLDYDGQVID
jgi:hypothetical protein